MVTSRKKRKGKTAAPLVPPPNKTMSRKRARQVTTQFHKLTRQREAAQQANDEQALQSLEQEITVMGGREAYQKASQVSTSFHSTSKWVLAHLSRNGWIYGVPTVVHADASGVAAMPKKPTKKEQQRRPTRILEVGAINTELLDAATTGGRLLQVRAVDLHAMDRRIEQADFLQLSVSHKSVEERYDVIVCSMVLNCVPTALQRGEMVCRLYHFVRPDGYVFITIPRTCLALSPYMDKTTFAALLEAVGFEVEETKESPKIAFYQCRKTSRRRHRVDTQWTQLHRIREGKKFTNDFSIVLSPESYASCP